MQEKPASNSNILVIFLFLAFMALLRVVLPFGDEPDFAARSEELKGTRDTLLFNPYGHVQFVTSVDTNAKCKITSSPLSLWTSLNPTYCAESLDEKLQRILITVLTALAPLLVVLLAARKFNAGKLITTNDLALSLLLPGTIYFLGLYSNEQLSLAASLIAMLFLRNLKILLPMLVGIFFLDTGNAVVVIAILLIMAGGGILYRRSGLRLVLVYSASIVVFALVVGPALLQLLYSVPVIGAKASAMTTQLTEGDYFEKYPLVLRPVITYMTAVFMTPAYVKSIPLYILFAGVSALCVMKYLRIRRAARTRTDLELKLSMCATATAGVLFFVYMFPTYGNAKYYIFLAPLYVSLARELLGSRAILGMLILSNAVLVLNLTFLYF